MKLELKHLSPYLPYGINTNMSKLLGVVNIIEPCCAFKDKFGSSHIPVRFIKPILRPLSDLTRKELESQGFWHHIDHLTYEKQNPLEAPFNMVQYLLSKHYDIFGLIKEGLAIDINTL